MTVAEFLFRCLGAPVLLAALAGESAVAQGPAAAAPQNVVRAIDVADRGGTVEVAIRGSRAPSYTVFKLQDPPRLVVDLASADVSALASPIKVGKGGVLSVSTAQYQDEKSAVGRVILSLAPAARYEVVPSGEMLLVKVQQGDGATATATANTTSTSTSTSTSTNSTAAGDNVVSRRTDAIEVAHPARAITGVRVGADRITLSADAPIARFEVIELARPPRLAIDLYGVAKAPRSAIEAGSPFRQVRFGKDVGKVRVVLDAVGEMPRYEVKRIERGLAIVLTRTAISTATATPIANVPANATPTTTSRRLAHLQDVRFTNSGGTSRIEVKGHAPHAVSRPDRRTLVLTLEGAALPKRLERSLDTTAFQGPVAMVSSFNQPSTGQVRIVATLRGEASDRLVETPAGLAWTFDTGAVTKHDAAEPVVLSDAAIHADAQAAGFTAEAPSYAVTGAPQRREYTGRRITLDFHDIDIRNLLRLIAEVSKKNIVVADDVQGKVTVSLRNVPWDQALDLVLKTKALGKEEMGNVIRVAKLEQIAKEQQARAEAEKARVPLLPLKVRLIPVNFARANDVASRVKDVLSERGTVSTDERTNVLIVKDINEALVRAEGIVRNLDTETPQVLIESRIIEATSNFSEQIGVQWGGNATVSPATGNPTGLAFPNIAGATGASAGNVTATAGAPNFGVDLPAAVGTGSGGAIGFTFGSASGAFNLNLRLSALESNGVVKTISAPKIATIDNKEATIGQGLSIPFSQVSASGVNTVFIEAKLELKVTPHVSADGSILMKIKATNNAPNPQLTGANGQPSISKREAETEVLVKDGETTVIGGIYTRQTAHRTAEVPLLGKIPILGYFFRTRSEQDDHTELLIFITPRILNRQPAAVAAAG